jgi:hypothetical protein
VSERGSKVKAAPEIKQCGGDVAANAVLLPPLHTSSLSAQPACLHAAAATTLSNVAHCMPQAARLTPPPPHRLAHAPSPPKQKQRISTLLPGPESSLQKQKLGDTG